MMLAALGLLVFLSSDAFLRAQGGEVDEVEVHLINIHEGAKGKARSAVKVRVERPGRNVLLALCNYQPVTWEISVAPDCNVQRVLMCGRPKQEVKGLPEDVPVEEPDGQGIPVMYHDGSMHFVSWVKKICERTKTSRLASFHGIRKAEEPIVIDDVQDNPRLIVGYPWPTPESELPAIAKTLVFPAHRYDGDQAAYAEFTLQGPREETLKPLPKEVFRVAFDPVGMRFFGVSRAGLCQVDLDGGAFELIETVAGEKPLTSAFDLTYDSKRKRFIVGSGEFLYVYDPVKGNTSLLASCPSLAAIAYSAHDDRIYGLTQGRHGGVPSVVTINSYGALLAAKSLSDPILPASFPEGNHPVGWPSNIVSLNAYLVLITPGSDPLRGESRTSYTYLVSLDSDEIWLTHKSPH